MVRPPTPALVALTAMVITTSACGQDSAPITAAEMTEVPSEAIAVVTVGPSQPPIVTKTDHTSAFAIDANGNLVGKLEGWHHRLGKYCRLEPRIHFCHS